MKYVYFVSFTIYSDNMEASVGMAEGVLDHEIRGIDDLFAVKEVVESCLAEDERYSNPCVVITTFQPLRIEPDEEDGGTAIAPVDDPSERELVNRMLTSVFLKK